MSERRLYQKFKDKMAKADPNCFCYKIPDWIGGGLRPFDFFLVIKGVPFAIEFKSEGSKLTKYQLYQMTDFVVAGGEAAIYWSNDDMDKFIEDLMEKAKKK